MQDLSLYQQHLLPVTQLHKMLCASPRPWPWFLRQMAFVKRASDQKKLIWCTNKQYSVQDLYVFKRELLAFGAEQLHLGTLLYDCDDVNGRRQRLWHEVVLDIDLTDFTRYCVCVQQTDTKRACEQCWLHIEGTQLLVRYLLCHLLLVEERHLLWVFSGKKGVHCLCNDPRLCTMDAQARKRLIALLRRDTTEELWQLAQELPSDVARQIEALFEWRGIEHRQLLCVESFRKHCLALVRQFFPALHNTLAQHWSVSRGSVKDWACLKQLQAQQQASASLLIALTVFYPRIDSGPLELKHKYKTPFSVHGDTQRVALPLKREALVCDRLPTHALGLRELVSAYRDTGKPCAQFSDSVHLFEQWLAQYDNT